MKNAAVCDQIPVQLLRRDLGIRAGLAGKGKASLPGFGEFYECQRGKIAGIHQQRPGIHTDALERLRQKAPLEIVADLADKGGAAPQLCGAGQHIGRRAAGILLKDCHAGIGVRQRGVVDQNFAQRHNVCRPWRTAAPGNGERGRSWVLDAPFAPEKSVSHERGTR